MYWNISSEIILPKLEKGEPQQYLFESLIVKLQNENKVSKKSAFGI